jgi:hypothetical protein
MKGRQSNSSKMVNGQIVGFVLRFSDDAGKLTVTVRNANADSVMENTGTSRMGWEGALSVEFAKQI